MVLYHHLDGRDLARGGRDGRHSGESDNSIGRLHPHTGHAPHSRYGKQTLYTSVGQNPQHQILIITFLYVIFTGGKVIFDEKDIELNAKYILITNNGALQVN